VLYRELGGDLDSHKREDVGVPCSLALRQIRRERKVRNIASGIERELPETLGKSSAKEGTTASSKKS